ncbi:hypothetical protein [Cellulomonas fimi]|nr:hypothetical protein [Cellulomonas fimi]
MTSETWSRVAAASRRATVGCVLGARWRGGGPVGRQLDEHRRGRG